ncbi:PREDICTED: probable prolyl 4-hydroxylase 10 [Nelumbo nucifera]|uniref:procollagen-proline 4-dioxygenase n=1 Tax=Nelumbo nucifera TaxID=4432 RepID=A0A1U8ASJ6_NELNU|nr:PREDICTED: probable prolyl 4-hydroxylase 10 [Nelumbo nucifera]
MFRSRSKDRAATSPDPATMASKKPKHSRTHNTKKPSPSRSKHVPALLLMLLFVLILLVAFVIFSHQVRTKGTPSAKDITSFLHKTVKSFDGLGEKEQQWTEVISWEPRAAVFHNFLSREECEYLIGLAKPRMEKSEVVDSTTGKSVDSGVRTSSGTFLTRGHDKIVRSIEERIAKSTFIPVEHGEGLHVLRYELGQMYEPHFDYFLDEFNPKNGGQRMATVLMYLSDVEEGGETVFPDAKGNISAVPWWNELSECAKKGLSVKPKMGDAILFWSMKPDATLDPSSLHGACPVIKGTKWSCAKWMRVNEYQV